MIFTVSPGGIITGYNGPGGDQDIKYIIFKFKNSDQMNKLLTYDINKFNKNYINYIFIILILVFIVFLLYKMF